ncbi:GntR family transcriptional regulator [Frankia canadensis]|uniref:GntR family transcriptional regulator n=1 Tax=Frankia canadensis TaxID=1836972 RepID=UPI00140248ED|nr:GntR family transcriptional regulator [Frankia canadensis]
MTTSLTPIQGHELLAKRVEHQLREAILAGELPPGSHLSVPELARRLGVSRTPVRDAVYALERAGLAEIRARHGAVVFGGSHDDLRHLFELREALDGMAARLGAARMTPPERDALREVLDQHTEAIRHADPDLHVAFDAEFHRLIRDGARNPRLADDLARLQDQIVLVMRAVSLAPGAMGHGVLHDHAAVLAAITRAEPETAERAMRAHIRAVLRFVEDASFEAEITG